MSEQVEYWSQGVMLYEGDSKFKWLLSDEKLLGEVQYILAADGR